MGRGAGCLDISALCLGTACLRGNSAISLRVSAIANSLWPSCLWGFSTISLGGGADCLGRGTGCLGISALCQGITCLRGTSCLGSSILWLGGTYLGTNCQCVDSSISLGDSVNYLGTTCWQEEVLSAWTALSAWELPTWGGETLAAENQHSLPRDCLFVWGEQALNQVIFPCFLRSNLLNLLTCLSIILRNLSSLTLSINCWHLSIIEVDTKDVSFDLLNPLVWHCLLRYYWWI